MSNMMRYHIDDEAAGQFLQFPRKALTLATRLGVPVRKLADMSGTFIHQTSPDVGIDLVELGHALLDRCDAVLAALE